MNYWLITKHEPLLKTWGELCPVDTDELIPQVCYTTRGLEININDFWRSHAIGQVKIGKFPVIQMVVS